MSRLDDITRYLGLQNYRPIAARFMILAVVVGICLGAGVGALGAPWLVSQLAATIGIFVVLILSPTRAR